KEDEIFRAASHQMVLEGRKITAQRQANRLDARLTNDRLHRVGSVRVELHDDLILGAHRRPQLSEQPLELPVLVAGRDGITEAGHEEFRGSTGAWDERLV